MSNKFPSVFYVVAAVSAAAVVVAVVITVVFVFLYNRTWRACALPLKFICIFFLVLLHGICPWILRASWIKLWPPHIFFRKSNSPFWPNPFNQYCLFLFFSYTHSICSFNSNSFCRIFKCGPTVTLCAMCK